MIAERDDTMAITSPRDPRQPVTVLITGAGTATCQSVIKGLRRQQEFPVRIVTVDMLADNAGRYFSDHFEVVPAAKSPQFLPTMLRIAQEQRVDLLIPIVDYEFLSFAEHVSDFAAIGCRVAISSPAVIRQCTDKWLTYEFFQRHQIPTPRTWLPEDLEVERLTFPVFVKPRVLGRGSIDAYPAETPTELKRLLERVSQPIIQDRIVSPEFTVDILCDFTGKVVNGVVRRRTETKAGVSYKGVTVRNDEVLSLAIRAAEALPIIGPANLQCFVGDRGIHFFEINPRYSGTLSLSIAAGFNSPLWLLRLMNGTTEPRQVGDYRVGVEMLRFWQEVFVDDHGQPLPTHDLTVTLP